MIDAMLIQRSANAILAAAPVGSRVILFGSRARGDARPQSDVDFLVIEPQVTSRIAESARLARVLRPLKVPADVVVLSHDLFEQWKDSPQSICFAASREGKVFS